MKHTNSFVGTSVRTYLYFDIGFVDGELADDLEWYLQLHVANARGLNEHVYVGQEDRINASDVVRYEIEPTDVNLNNIENIRQLITVHTDAWVSSMGGTDCVN